MRFLPYALLLTLALLCPGCGKSEAERQMSDMTAKQREIVTVLKDVNDVESAKAANVKIKAITKDVQAILDRSKGTKSSQAERDRLAEKYKPQQQAITNDAQAELKRIGQNPAASRELIEGLLELSAVGARAATSK